MYNPGIPNQQQTPLYPALQMSFQEMGERTDVSSGTQPLFSIQPSAPPDFPSSQTPTISTKPTSTQSWIVIRVWRWFVSSQSENFEEKFRKSMLKIEELRKELTETQETVKQYQKLNAGLNTTISENQAAQAAFQTSYQEISNKANFLETENSRLKYEKNELYRSLGALTEEKTRTSEMNVTLTAGIQTEKEKSLLGKVKILSEENAKLKARMEQVENLFRKTKEQESKLQVDFNGLAQSMVELQESKKSIETALSKEQDANARLLRTIPKIAIYTNTTAT